jgi:hypothetical protein
MYDLNTAYATYLVEQKQRAEKAAACDAVLEYHQVGHTSPPGALLRVIRAIGHIRARQQNAPAIPVPAAPEIPGGVS